MRPSLLAVVGLSELWWGFRVVLWIWHFPVNEFQVHPAAKHGHELKADKCNKHARVFNVRQVPSMKKRREFRQLSTHKSLRTLYASDIPGGQQHFYVANEKDESHFLKPRPNDRKMSTQHIATLLGATCCVRLATVLRCVAACRVLLAQVWNWSNLRHQHPTCSQHGGQTQATCCAQQCCDMLCWRCCYRLAGA